MLIHPFASMGYSSICILICTSIVCLVGVCLSSNPSISGPGSATERAEIYFAILGRGPRAFQIGKISYHTYYMYIAIKLKEK